MAELTLTALRVVAEVARAGSFSAAAERLGYTQSAVSRQVAAAERVAGGTLFTRGARGVAPTAAGRALAAHAGRVLAQLEAATAELAGLRDRLAGRVAVGAYPTAMAHLVPRALAHLLGEHPGVQVHLVEAPTPSLLSAVRRGRLQVAVVATGDGLPQPGEDDLAGLARTELPAAGVGVAVGVEHPFAGRAQVDPGELADQRWVVGASDEDAPASARSAGSAHFGAWPGLADPVVAFAVRSWPARLGLVAAGLGIALVPGSMAAALPAEVRWVAVATGGRGLGRTTWAVTAGDPQPVAAAVVAALAEQARRQAPAVLP